MFLTLSLLCYGVRSTLKICVDVDVRIVVVSDRILFTPLFRIPLQRGIRPIGFGRGEIVVETPNKCSGLNNLFVVFKSDFRFNNDM